ncbi:hypothetical protein DFQ26_006539 [Actinomortierella ambigua]|nr:hypothetical protein DFQ26_006539 [Actinomortierella ambigua]
MPSDTSTNFKTSAAAALCARLVIHPLDNIKVSIQFAPGVQDGVRSRVTQLARQFSGHLNALPSLDQAKRNVHDALDTGKRQLRLQELGKKAHTAFGRGLYQGVAFAVLFQVPGLALFLTTYDTCKNGIHKVVDMYAPELDGLFRPTSTETHLLSGLLAKSSGNLVWSPMIRIQSIHQSLTGSPSQAPISIQNAVHAIRHILTTEGLPGLWSGYLKNVGSLLPYTMIYFATYEQFKQVARWVHSLDIQGSVEQLLRHFNGSPDQLVTSIISSIASFFRGPGHTSRNKDVEFWEGWWEDLKNSRSLMPSPMPLPAYMACVSGSVALSATVCHLSTGIVKIHQERRLARAAATASKAPTPVPTITNAHTFKAATNVQMYPSKTALQLQSGSSILFPGRRRPSLTAATTPTASGLASLGVLTSSAATPSTTNARPTTTACARGGITFSPATTWSGMTASPALRLQNVIPLQLKQLLTSNKNAHNTRSAAFGVLSGVPWPHNHQHATLTTASIQQSFSNHIHPITKQPQLGSAMRPTVAPSIPYPPPTPAMASRFAASLHPSSSSSSSLLSTSTTTTPTSMGTTFRSMTRAAANMTTCYDTLPNDMKTLSPSSFTNQPRPAPLATLMNTTSPLGPAPTGYAPSQVIPYQTSTAPAANNTTVLWRTLMRGLGSRILWTVPGVTLTTAGFEVLRIMAKNNE